MRKFAVFGMTIGAACFGDSIVSVDAGDTGPPIHLEVGQRLDVSLFSCQVSYDEPVISTSAVKFTGSDVPQATPGCHTTVYHLVGQSAGTATVVFRRGAPATDAVMYTVEVR